MTKIEQGHILDTAAGLPAKAYQSIITSPPYWMLRDYGTPPQLWPAMIYAPMPGLGALEVSEWRGELGQEPDINMFIGHLVHCFRVLKPALRDDGTLWINLGDCYFTTGKTTGIASSSSLQGRKQELVIPTRMKKQSKLIPNKNTAGVPWRFSLAMQADGWYWRDTIIWWKTSPMPGSQTDRCTVSHEVILMFSKQERYFYDHHAIQEKCTGHAHSRGKGTTPKSNENSPGVRNNDSFSKAVRDIAHTRNARSVWPVWRMGTEPSKEKHFASWPSWLAAKMIKASTSEHGACAKCGAPYKKKLRRDRVATRPGMNSKLKQPGQWASSGKKDAISYSIARRGLDADSPYWEQNGKIHGNRDPLRHTTILTMVGWVKTCQCKTKKIVPCKVLDPFGGTGKTALAAERLHRECTLIELNQQYADRAKMNLERLRKKEAGMFA